ncbi:hypothetical protein [Chitinimonas lacunae]|uniref:DUF4124 domain-containing protein n=1 Tax=Chitinimonas lacunae TaxID=1963018 RepID=A0ABV8MT28_9NEIS
MLRILLSLALLVPVAAADTDFIYRDGEPLAGSHIRPIRLRSPLPYDKRYDQLDARERERLRANYREMPVNCEPPFPEAGLKPLLRELVRLQDQKGLDGQGSLSLLAQVDAKGEVASVAALESPSPELGALGSVILFNTRFKPARCDGTPLAMDYLLEVELVDLLSQGVSGRALTRR